MASDILGIAGAQVFDAVVFLVVDFFKTVKIENNGSIKKIIIFDFYVDLQKKVFSSSNFFF